jgi:hypothetical protein
LNAEEKAALAPSVEENGRKIEVIRLAPGDYFAEV